MMKNEKMLSRAGWWRMRVRLSLVGVLSVTLALGSILATPSPVQAAERHVCASGCSYTSIQDAIDAAISGDTIKVAQGTYYENLYISKDITLLGGYSPPDWTTQGSASSTVIDATGLGDSVIRIGGSSASGTTIENFTIQGGTGHDYSSWGWWSVGGGIEVWTATVTIRNNVIQGNSADEGGGINIRHNLGSQILNNTITGNTATRANGIGWGGGVTSNDTDVTLQDNVITNNTAYWGGGFLLNEDDATLKDNVITNNTAKWGGGFLLWHSLATIEGNIITGNRALGGDAVGGAFFIEEAVPIIKNNIIARNTAQNYADGIYIKVLDPTHPGVQAQIVNNTIVANKYSDHKNHAGIFVRAGISPIIYNNVIALNGSGVWTDSRGPYPVLSNNDVWGNTVADYSGLSPGTTDISEDPLFVDQIGGDYHLQEGSPCIDAGTSSNAPPTDFEGDARPVDGDGNGSALWDIGADEYTMMWIAKRASPSSADPGDAITYTITYRNDSMSTATGVVITDTLSSNLLNPNATSSGASITPTGGTSYVWDVENLSVGSGGIITITAQIDPSVVTPTAILNTAEFYAVETGSLSDDAPVVVGGLKTYLPLILRSY